MAALFSFRGYSSRRAVLSALLLTAFVYTIIDIASGMEFSTRLIILSGLLLLLLPLFTRRLRDQGLTPYWLFSLVAWVAPSSIMMTAGPILFDETISKKEILPIVFLGSVVIALIIATTIWFFSRKRFFSLWIIFTPALGYLWLLTRLFLTPSERKETSITTERKRLLRNIYFSTKGRISRSELWFFLLVPNAIVAALWQVAAVVLSHYFYYDIQDIKRIAYWIIAALSLLLLIPLTIKRMHDHNLSGKRLFLLLIPVLGWIYWLYIVYLSTFKLAPREDNHFGSPSQQTLIKELHRNVQSYLSRFTDNLRVWLFPIVVIVTLFTIIRVQQVGIYLSEINSHLAQSLAVLSRMYGQLSWLPITLIALYLTRSSERTKKAIPLVIGIAVCTAFVAGFYKPVYSGYFGVVTNPFRHLFIALLSLAVMLIMTRKFNIISGIKIIGSFFLCFFGINLLLQLPELYDGWRTGEFRIYLSYVLESYLPYITLTIFLLYIDQCLERRI